MNDENYILVLKNETGTQLTSPLRVPYAKKRDRAEFAEPLSPARVNNANNPFQITPTKTPLKSPAKENGSPFVVPSPKIPIKKIRTLNELMASSDNQDKKNELKKLADFISANLDLAHTHSYYQPQEEMEADKQIAREIKYLLKPAVVNALRDKSRKFLMHLKEKAVITAEVNVNALLDNIQTHSGHLPSPEGSDPFDVAFHRQRNTNIFKAFISFDLENRDISNKDDWDAHPALAKTREHLLGKSVIEIPEAVSKPAYPKFGFFQPEEFNIDSAIKTFDEIQTQLRNGIVNFDRKAPLEERTVDNFIKDKIRELIALRDKFEPNSSEKENFHAVMNKYINFTYALMEQANLNNLLEKEKVELLYNTFCKEIPREKQTVTCGNGF